MSVDLIDGRRVSMPAPSVSLPKEGEPGGPDSWSGFGLGVLFVGIWIALSGVLIDGISGFYRESRQRRLEQEVGSLLPLLRNRAKPAILMEEKLLGAIRGIREVNPQTMQIMKKRLRKFFPISPPFCAYDSWGKLVAEESHPSISQVVLRGFSYCMALDEMNKFGELYHRNVARLSSAATLVSFPRETSVSVVENISQVDPGLIFRVLFSAKREPSPLGFPNFNNGGYFEPNQDRKDVACWGRLALFISEQTLNDRGFQERALQQPPPAFPFPCWTGPLEAFDSCSELPAPIRDEVKIRMKKGFQQVFSRDGWLIGCVRIHAFREMIGLIYIPPNHSGNPVMMLAAFLSLLTVFALGAPIAGFKLGWLKRHWICLADKFTVFAVTALMVPVMSLGWLFLFQEIWKNQNRYSETLAEMQRSLTGLENQSFFIENGLLQKVTDLLERYSWHRESPPLEELAKFLNRSLRGILDAFSIFTDQEKTITFGNYNPDQIRLVGGDNEPNPAILLVNSLMEVFAYSLKMQIQKDGTDSRLEEMRLGVLMETLQSLVGGYSGMVNILSRPSRLVIIKAGQEAAWVYFRIFRTKALKAQKVLFFIFMRKNVQKDVFQELTTREERLHPGAPEISLLGMLRRDYNRFFPARYAGEPVLVNSMRTIALEGGTHRLPLLIGEKRYLAIVKRLPGLDYIGAVLRPYPENPITLWSSPWLLALLTYFFFLIGLLAKAFRLLYIQPVQVFQKGVERISAGNYDWRLPITATDELGELSADFNRMAAGLQEKDFMARFVSDLAMEAVKKTGKSPAVRVVGSVLFADIRGFTTLSESFSPEEVVDMLNNYLTRMEEVIENNDGVIDKFIGDAIMAVFLPIHGKALPAERAVRAGIAMIMATREFSRERETAGAFAVRNGVGIATGRLLMGVLGKSAGRQDFTVTGLTVNLAAQMEKYSKLARQLPVVICQQTAAELAGMVAIEPLAGTPADIAAFEVVP